MNRICYVMRGISGSGKSTLGKQIQSENQNTEIVSADLFWDKNGYYDFDFKKLSEAHSWCFENFKKAILKGSNVIIDNTNLNYSSVKKYLDHLLENNSQSEFQYSIKFVQVSYNDVNTAIALRKDRADGKNVPEKTIRGMFKQFKNDIRINILKDFSGKLSLNDLDELSLELPWKESEKTKAIICDLDGTLSIFEYVSGLKLRNCYDASKADEDIVCLPVAEALRGFCSLGYEIIFVSGREERFREPTEKFLKTVSEKFCVNWSKLYMRPSKDFRKDYIIKEEIYERELKDYNVLAVFDDRPQVISMWRSKGLYVFDCNYRGEDF